MTLRPTRRASLAATAVLAAVLTTASCGRGVGLTASTAGAAGSSGTPVASVPGTPAGAASPVSGAGASGAGASGAGASGAGGSASVSAPAGAPAGSGATTTGDGDLGLAVPTDTSDRSWRATSPPASQARVLDVRSAAHPGFDRVVVDLSGPVAGYLVRWLPRGGSLVQGEDGAPVALQGDRVLQVVLMEADDTQARDDVVGLPAVREVRRQPSEEATSLLGLGVATGAGSPAVGFRVSTLAVAGGSRLVVDVAHAPATAPGSVASP